MIRASRRGFGDWRTLVRARACDEDGRPRGKGGVAVNGRRGGGAPSAQARFWERGRWGGAAPEPKGSLVETGGFAP